MAQPLVSILIPVYNREVLVCIAIDSALAQTYKNIELIVCDNASTDHTWDVLQEYEQKDKRIRIFRNESNVGPVRNWAECIKHANGKYAKFLWSDDEILPSFVEIMVNAMENNPSCGFAYSCVDIKCESKIYPRCYTLSNTGYHNSQNYVEGASLERYNIPRSPGCALFYLDTLRKHLMIDIPNNEMLDFSRYGAGNDQLLFLCACEDYSEMYYYNESLSIFYGGADSISIQNPLDRYYMLAIFYFMAHTKRYKKVRNAFYKSKLYNNDYYALVPHYKMRKCYYGLRKSIKRKLIEWHIIK